MDDARQREIYDEIINYHERPPATLTPALVVTEDDWERLRQLRNACRDGFTHCRDEITPEQQAGYRVRCMSGPYIRHYLYSDASGPVGFSRLEWRDGWIYPTMGVDPQARGRGYGWQIMALMLMAAGGPLRGDLLLANDAIKHVDYTLGWLNAGDARDGVQPVACAWPPPFLGDAWRRSRS